MIRATNISFRFQDDRNTLILKDVSFEVSMGETLAIVGPSGCGKTTLLRLISGYLQPNNGTISLDNELPNNQRQNIGMFYQDHRLLPWRNLIRNITLPLEILGKSLEDPLLPELMKLLHLERHQKKFPVQLSGGLQERTALARVLVSKPRFLLLDEPLGSTDYVHRLEIENYIYNIVHNEKKCCIIVTHDLEQAVAVADSILLLGFSSDTQSHALLKVPKKIREARPSEARILADTPIFLNELLSEYHKISLL